MSARALLLAVALLAAGCPPARVERPYPPPTANELLAALRARADKLQTLRAEARADHMGEGGERIKVTVTLLLGRGGRMRIEAESPLGGALATLTSDGEKFALLDVQHNRFLVGPAAPCNVGRLVGVELPADEVVQLLMGGAPLDGEPLGARWDASHGGREVLELRTRDGGSETVQLDGRERRWDVLAAERRDARGRVLWRLEHDDFSDHNGVRLPRKTAVEEPPHHADVQIRWRTVEPNVTPPDGAFRQAPAGLAPELVLCDRPALQ